MSKTAYHHGEASMHGTVIKMAQNFWCSNNINLLEPDGAFGSRNQGGDDAASPRYVQTMISKLSNLIYNSQDFPLYEYLQEETKSIEPKWYLPIIPMVLVNGINGIGTGFSCKVPKYNPEDIIKCLLELLRDDKIKTKLVPWYRLFAGKIEPTDGGNFISRGVWKRVDETTIEITELPVGIWSTNYKEFLESSLEGASGNGSSKSKSKKSKEFLKDYKSDCTDYKVKFTVMFLDSGYLDKLVKESRIEKEMRLLQNINISNMHLFDENGTVKKYKSPNEIILYFYKLRLHYYQLRKDNLVRDLQLQLEILSSKVRFILEIINGKLVIFKKKKKDIEELLAERKYPKLVDNSFNYLTSMPIYTFSYEKILELKRLREDKAIELETLSNKTNKDLWVDDLVEFKTEYLKWKELQWEECTF